MRSLSALLLCTLLVAANGCKTAEPPSAAPPAPGARLDAAAGTITADEVRTHLAFLASDEMAGRDTPSPGLERAAEYVARELAAAGLAPRGDAGTYLQRYPLHLAALVRDSVSFTTTSPAGDQAWRYAHDFAVLEGRQQAASGPAVLLRPSPGALDRFDEGVRGRVVVAFLPTGYADIFGVVYRAAQAGALGVVYISPPALGPVTTLAEVFERRDAGLYDVPPVPLVFFDEDAGRTLLRGYGLDPDALLDGTAPAGAPLLPLDGTFTIRAAARYTDHQPPNVVAVLPGSDPALRDTYVVLSAHFDHVGVGTPDETGDAVYNGADDNASGTTLLLEVAEAFAALSPAPRRSILLLAVSGEEKGLLGSTYFVDHAPVPITQVVANLNVDMVGRNAPDTLYAIGDTFTSLGPLARRVAQERGTGLHLAPDPYPEENLFLRSDQFSFVRKGVPALFFTSGLHPDYHRPSDEIDLIDVAKATRVARLLFYLAAAVADDPTPPAWTEAGLDVRRLLE